VLTGQGRRQLRGVGWAALLLTFAVGGSISSARAASAGPVITLHTDELAGPPLMGLGVQLDPYDSFQPTQADWARTFQRLDYMRPGFIRVVEPASDYFARYDAAHDPVYRWNGRHVVQLRTILDYARSRGITVVLGDWSNPMINGDARIPADFLAQLHDVYGYTNIRYFNLINEPNYLAGCDFGCWTGIVRALSKTFTALGLGRWLKLVGPDNANSWDDTPSAQALDRKSGLDTDNPIGGDSWVTMTLHSVRGLVGPYDSHRYATMWGIEHGVYGDQMRARREQINNLDSPGKAYFADGSQNLKQWGFWNSLGGRDGYPASDLQLRPWYYPWSVLARSFPAGSQALAVPSTGVAGLRIAAAKIPSAGRYQLSLAVVNDSDVPRSVVLAVPAGTRPLTFARYDYFAGERPVDSDGFPVAAQVLEQVQLASGLRIQLPSRGLVVLSSLGFDAPSVLSDGRRTLRDGLDGWGKVYARSKGLKFDHGHADQFNGDRSRATPRSNAVQYLVYRASQMTSFELKAYYRKRPGIAAYGSHDGRTWTPIRLASTNPAPTVAGNQWYLAETLPGAVLPVGTDQLKIELSNSRTELSQVLIQSR
jgi:hypothetical protein